jgi:hypothetical protein
VIVSPISIVIRSLPTSSGPSYVVRVAVTRSGGLGHDQNEAPMGAACPPNNVGCDGSPPGHDTQHTSHGTALTSAYDVAHSWISGAHASLRATKST